MRTAEFAKDLDYEALLERVNATAADFTVPSGPVPVQPATFVMGVPRSGTTLLYQALAATGAFAYPTNLAARFYRSPAFGHGLERLLSPLLPARGPMAFTSRAGNTDAWWGPHEFGYFWGAHLPFADHHQPPGPGEADAPDLTALAGELARMEAVADRPLLFKNGILCFAVANLVDALPTARIVRVTRDPHDVVASILAMRERFAGDRDAWWSVRPAGADEVADRAPVEQVVWQVRRTTAALMQHEVAVDVTYADLCADPRGVVEVIGAAVGVPVAVDVLPATFPHRRADRDPAIEAALAR
jgi:hypothetical protein